MVAGGLLGRKWSEILAEFDGFAKATTIETELEFLAADDCVQKFIVPPMGRRGGRSYTVWRATTKIMEVAT